MADIPPHIEAFWERFLVTRPSPAADNAAFYESCRIGTEPEHADEGARLILAGIKTATSSLLSDYDQPGQAAPAPGALTVFENGKGEPVCVVETTWVQVIPFDEVDEQFARDYAETDGTLEDWRKTFFPYYASECTARGLEMSGQTALVCERFRVIFP